MNLNFVYQYKIIFASILIQCNLISGVVNHNVSFFYHSYNYKREKVIYTWTYRILQKRETCFFAKLQIFHTHQVCITCILQMTVLIKNLSFLEKLIKIKLDIQFKSFKKKKKIILVLHKLYLVCEML